MAGPGGPMHLAATYRLTTTNDPAFRILKQQTAAFRHVCHAMAKLWPTTWSEKLLTNRGGGNTDWCDCRRGFNVLNHSLIFMHLIHLMVFYGVLSISIVLIWCQNSLRSWIITTDFASSLVWQHQVTSFSNAAGGGTFMTRMPCHTITSRAALNLWFAMPPQEETLN